jgi:hypothetical protein
MVIERVARWPADRSHDAASMQLLGTAAFNLGFHSLASRFLTASIDTMRDQGRLVQLAQSLVMRAWSEINLGRWTVAAPDAEEGARLAHETAQPIWKPGPRLRRRSYSTCAATSTLQRSSWSEPRKSLYPPGVARWSQLYS